MTTKFFFYKIIPLSLCLFFGITKTRAQIQAIRMLDSAQLVRLYEATDGANWTTKWNLNQPMDTWYGIKLTNQRVTCIDLDGSVSCTPLGGRGGNNLVGTIPDLNLANLELLSLASNKLTGSIPSFALPNLKYLSLSSNKLTGDIPDFNLPVLIELNLSYNQLSGTVPNLNLPKLETLDLSTNELSGNLPSFTLPNLRELSFAINQLTGSIPSFSMPNLTDLYLFTNQLSGTIPNFNLPKLQYLSLSDNQLTGNIPNFNLSELQSLDLSTNKLSGNTPSFNLLTNLNSLNLSSNQLTGNIPSFNLPLLQTLGLHTNKLTGNIPNLNLPSLISIFLNSNQLTGNVPSFPNLTKLSRIYLNDNKLSGCFPTDWQRFCRLKFNANINNFVDSSYNILNNVLLPWQGDFQRFCNNEIQIGASCNDNLSTTFNDKIQADCSCKGGLTLVDTSACRYKDSLQLVALYNATNGANWTNKWILTQPMTTWQGVFLNAQGCVTVLSPGTDQFNGNNMVGILPAAIGNLTSLQTLSISGNKDLTGSIPPEIGKLKTLTSLTFYLNNLSGALPKEIGNLTNLTYLVIMNRCTGSCDGGCKTGLTGTIPTEIGNLVNLNYLSLSQNTFTGMPPVSLRNLSKLGSLRLEFNRFDSIPNLTNITTWSRVNPSDGLQTSCNKLTFDDILPNLPIGTIGGYGYQSQDSIFVETTITVALGAPLSINLGIDGALTDNVYTWKRDGNPATSNLPTNLNRFVRNAAALSDAGVYTCQVTNPRAPLLTLNSRKIKVIVTQSCSGTPTTTTLMPSICSGKTYTLPNGQTVSPTANTTYRDTVRTSGGCDSVIRITNLTVITLTPPSVNSITQPTCNLSTGSVVLSGLPAGTWTINPGAITGTGTTRTITGLAAGTYNFTVSNTTACISAASANVAINPAPTTPSPPSVGTITQPNCNLSTGRVVLNGLPTTGSWTINPGAITGTGTTRTITGLAAGTYNFTVTNAATCISTASANVVINPASTAPSPPSVGSITQPTCSQSTGSVVLNGLPATGTWTINPGAITGTGTTKTITGLAAGTYNFTVTNAAACISTASANVVINPASTAPSPPSVGTITQPTCTVSTGSVVLNSLPATGTWTIYPGAITGTGTTKTITGLAAGTYNFTVTNTATCISSASASVVLSAATRPIAPSVGTITQPTCTVSTGSVVLNGLPTTGTWTLTGVPSGTITGTGTTTTVTGLAPSTYSFIVNLGGNCSSTATQVTINTVSSLPTAPTIGTITQPTCTVATGSIVLNSLPATGTWTIIGAPSGTITGTGTTTTVTGLVPNTYSFIVTVGNTCRSVSSAKVIINAVPNAPTAPSVGTITQPTCSVSTGSVILNGLPSTGTWTIKPNNITGSGTSKTVVGLAAGTYNFAFTNAAGCTSLASTNVLINAQPLIPSPPVLGKITESACNFGTGSIELTGLPTTGSWTIIPNGQTGTGASTTITKLGIGTYSYAVANNKGCISSPITATMICTNTDEKCLTDLENNIPNGFTPGDNGSNDLFDPKKYLILSGCSKNITAEALHIYNRWGEMVFKGVPYNFWDGRAINQQKIVPTGVYYFVFVVSVEGKRKSIKGVLNLFSD